MDDQVSFQLYLASAEGDLEQVEELCKDPEINLNWQDIDFYRSPFFKACEENHLEVVRFFLGLDGVDLNLANKGKASPFYVACREGHVDVVALLLTDDRINVNKVGKDRATPFAAACEAGHVAVVKLLLADERVDINKPTMDDATPFHAACENGHVGVVSVLVADNRIDVNKPKLDRSTPLWIATNEGCVHVVQHLLASGREIALKKMAAQLAKYLAQSAKKDPQQSEADFRRKKANFREIAEIFEAYERDPDTTRWQLVRELHLDGETPFFRESFLLPILLIFYYSFLPRTQSRRAFLLGGVLVRRIHDDPSISIQPENEKFRR